VGNPGPLTVTVTSGGLQVGEGEDALAFPFPECVGGVPEEGFDSCVTLSGDVDEDGNLTVPADGVSFPTLIVPLDVSDLLPGLVLDLEVLITAPNGATGQIDPATGELDWDLTLDISIQDADGLLAEDCGLRGIALSLTTDASGALTGVAYDDEDGTATVVDNTFVVPAASGCGNLFGLIDIDDAVNDALDLPSAPGDAFVTLAQVFDPILVAGEGTDPTDPTDPVLASIDVMGTTTTTVHSFGADVESSDGSGALDLNVVLRNDTGGVYTVPEGETVEIDWVATTGAADVALTDLVASATAVLGAGETATGTLVFAEGTSSYALSADAVAPTSLELAFSADGLEGDSVTLTWNAPPPGAIDGVVTDGTSDEALEGVEVTLTDAEDEVVTTTTDADGAYGFDDLVAGTYTATFELDGYDAATETIAVEAGQTTTVDVALLELGAITGIATDGSTFLPVAGASVVVGDADGVVAETTTGADGRFSVVVPAGDYLVTVSTADFTGGSQAAEVAPGQTVDLAFTLVELATISGQLLDEESGDPVEGATVTVLTANPGQFVASTTTDADGRYTLRVPPGAYELVFDLPGYDPTSRFVTVGPGDEAVIDAPITPRVEISGRVTDSERGLPVEGALVEFISPDPVVGPISIDVQAAALSLPGGAFGGTRQLQNPGTLNATVDETGNLAIASGQTVGSWVMNFAHASTPSNTDYDVRMDLNLTGNGTGQIDAATGQVAVNGQFEIRATQISPNFGGTAGGRGTWPLRSPNNEGGAPVNCRAPGINIGLTTGTSGPVAGSPVDPFTGEAVLAGGQFTVPAFTGCPSFSGPTLNVNTYANGLLGLASNTLGNNRLVLDVQLPVNATQVVTDADGRYAVNVPTGDIFTFISRDGFAPLRDEGTVDDGSLRDVYVRDYVMTATRSVLTGSVTDAYTAAQLSGATVTVRQDDIGLVETTTTGPNGSYTFGSLPRGPVDVTVELDGYEVFEETVVLRAAQTSLLEVALDPILSTLDGSVLDDIDGQPIADATVTLTELTEDGEVEFGTTTSAADGSYGFAGIPQGTYRVTGAGFEYVTTSVEDVVFTPGDQLLQDLRLPPVGVFTGTVVDDDTGAPISGAQVTVLETGESVFTGGDGSYRITVIGGDYRLEFEANGYAPAFREVTVANGQSLTVNVELEPYTTAGGGTIRDGLTGNRLAGATVRVLDAGGAEVESLTTNNDGRFTLPALAAGVYALEVSQDGYITRTFPITVVPGQPLTANLALDPVATVSGVVTATETGDPIEDAEVTILSGGTTVETATTDADGSYVAEVAGGNYTVSITAEDRNTVTQNVSLARGGSVTVDAALTLLPATLTVTTTDAQTEEPVAGATVTVSRDGSTVATEATGIDGTATFDLAPGDYSVLATADNYGGGSTDVALAPAEQAEVSLVLDPDAASVAVTVTDADTDAPVQGATITVVDLDEQVVATATTDDAGQATLTDLPQGDHLVVVAADGYETLEEPVSLAPGDALVLELTLEPLPATVSGVVTDSVSGDGVEGAAVTLSDEDGEVATTTTDADGAYSITGLAQGDYTVAVTADDYEDGAGSASVGPGGSATVDVVLVPFAEILGEVVDASSGEPIANLGVRILAGGVPVQGVDVDQATATFSAGVPAGPYTIEILSAGLSITTRNVTVSPAQQLLETFVVNLGQVTGVVTDAEDDTPIADAIVTFTRTLGGQTGTVTTDAAGSYRIDLQPGGYAITVSATGYEATSIPAQSFGTDGGTQDVQLAPSPGSLTGTVVNDVNGTPVAGASVALVDGDDATVATTTSAADGSFTLAGLDRGTYTLVIDGGTGYDLRTITGVVVTQGQSNALGNLAVVSQPATLSGTVSSGGDPVQGAQVALLNDAGTVVTSTTTDADGDYQITGIVTGTYTARVTASGFVTDTGSVSFAPGQSVTRNVTLTPTGTLPVTVVDQDGEPISATVELVSGGDAVDSFEGSSGSFTAAVGSYTVTADRDGYEGDSESVTLVAGENDAVELTITALPTTVQGVTRDGVSNAPIAGATVTLTDGEDTTDTIESGADGSFAFTGVAAGTYTLSAEIDGYGPVSREVTTTPGQTVTADLTFAWTVQVTVRDAVTGETVPGQEVTVSNGETITATTDAAGRTRLTLAPGSYTLFTQVEDRAPITRQITVSAGVAQSVTLTAQLASSVSGTVASSFEATLLEDATVTLLQGDVEIATEVTGEDGTYAFAGLAAGVYQLQADATQHESETFSVTVPAATDVTRNLVLEATPVTVSGVVSDFDSEEPIAGAT
jgi:large repetitive protein